MRLLDTTLPCRRHSITVLPIQHRRPSPSSPRRNWLTPSRKVPRATRPKTPATSKQTTTALSTGWVTSRQLARSTSPPIYLCKIPSRPRRSGKNWKERARRRITGGYTKERTQEGQKQEQRAVEKGQIGIYSHHPFTPDVLNSCHSTLPTNGSPRRKNTLAHHTCMAQYHATQGNTSNPPMYITTLYIPLRSHSVHPSAHPFMSSSTPDQTRHHTTPQKGGR